MKAVITVIGTDRVGIIAAVSTLLAECNTNILDITQTTMEKMFTMIMFVDNSKINITFAELADKALALGFAGVAAGPFVRSSYQAESLYHKAMRRIEVLRTTACREDVRKY